MKKLKSLSIFFPTLNDSQILPSLIKKASQTAKIVSQKFEILAINDGSNDNTVEVLEKLKKIYPELKIINHKKNLGYGTALISGFKNSTKDWVFYTDGDGQYNPKELILLTENLDVKTDIVNGYKLKREDAIVRKAIGRIYNLFLQKIYHLPISDVDCDFRLIKRAILKKIELESTSGAICLEIILKLKKEGANFKEVGVNHYKRKFGKSQFFTFKNILGTLKDNLLFFLRYYFYFFF